MFALIEYSKQAHFDQSLESTEPNCWLPNEGFSIELSRGDVCCVVIAGNSMGHSSYCVFSVSILMTKSIYAYIPVVYLLA